MREGVIFWEQEVSATGADSVAVVQQRLRSLLSHSRFNLKEALVGSVEASAVRVWRYTPFGQAGDIVEFQGAILPSAEGSVIKGSVAYTLRTKIQFLGFLGLGVGVLAIGLRYNCGNIALDLLKQATGRRTDHLLRK